MILSDPSHWMMITKASLGKRPMMYFGFMGDLYSLKIWWDLKLWGNYNPSYIPWVVARLIFQTWYDVAQGKPIYDRIDKFSKLIF